MRRDIRAWPHKASTENGNTRLLSNFPAEQSRSRDPANDYSIFILLNRHRPQGCPQAALSRFTLTLDAVDSIAAQVSKSWRAQ